jgi:hypothetical protein
VGRSQRVVGSKQWGSGRAPGGESRQQGKVDGRIRGRDGEGSRAPWWSSAPQRFPLEVLPGWSCGLCFVLVGLGFELRALHLQSRHYHLNQTSSPFCSGYFGDGGLMNCLPKLASNLSPLDLSLSSSWDYRYEAQVPDQASGLNCGKG